MWAFACLVLLVAIIVYIVACTQTKNNDPVRWIKKSTSSNYAKSQKATDSIFDTLDDGFDVGPKASTLDSMSDIMGSEGMENGPSGEEQLARVQMYDPLTQGGLKKTEIESHYKNLSERSPFATVGAARADQFVRDDDEIARTGIPWVFRPPTRAYNNANSGPQSGARQVTSESGANIERLRHTGSGVTFNW